MEVVKELLRPQLRCGCSTHSWGSLEMLSWQRAGRSRVFRDALLKCIAVLALMSVSPRWLARLMPPKCLLRAQQSERQTEDCERDQE